MESHEAGFSSFAKSAKGGAYEKKSRSFDFALTRFARDDKAFGSYSARMASMGLMARMRAVELQAASMAMSRSNADAAA